MVDDQKYTVADVRYFRRAVRFMMRKFPQQLVFVVCTDDTSWSQENFPNVVSRAINYETAGVHGNRSNHSNSDSVNKTTAKPRSVVVVFSEDRSAAEDLAILSSCNHTIMTVGTFGWWGGYLAGGLTVYYRNFPAKGFELYQHFSREDHFPPGWVGL